MTTSSDYRRGYRAGYSAGASGKWPHLSPVPGDRYTALAVAAVELANKIDAMLAQFDDRDVDPAQKCIDRARSVVYEEIERARTDSLGGNR